MGQKNQKGTVAISNAGGRIRLRWRCLGKRYSLNYAAYSKQNILFARKVAVQIETDILFGVFDSTLEKYSERQHATKPIDKSVVAFFEEWAREYKQMDCNVNVDYYHLRNTLKKWGEFKDKELLRLLNKENFGPKSYNSRLAMLQSFAQWMVKSGNWELNMLEEVSRKKLKKGIKEGRKPFSEQEIAMILEAIHSDRFTPKCSRYNHSHYYPFMYFLFKTGVRPAEAVGLRVGSLDWEKDLVYIKEVLARTLKGTHDQARIRKETKNGKERMLPLTADLKAVLLPIAGSRREDELVFLSPTGKAIDDRMFQRRVFKPVLKALNIEERVLYACRHTFGSRCIDAGITPVMTAFLMGNNPETALRNYTHQIAIPKELPEI